MQIKQAKLGVGVASDMQYNESVAVADDALDVKVIYRRHLRRNMIVFKVFGHFCKFASLAKTEDRRTFVDIDDALMAHTEREAAILVHKSITSQQYTGKSGLIWTDK